MNDNQKKSRPNNKSIGKRSKFLAAAMCACVAFSPAALRAATFDRTGAAIENRSKDDDFDKSFREGRDFIDRGEWARAAEKFSEAVGKYPNGKAVDAALYWLAFSYKKQRKFKETDAALSRLLKEFPASAWADDARVMRAEIGFAPGGVFSAVSIADASSPARAAAYPTVVAGNVYNSIQNLNAAQLVRTYDSAPAVSLDRADEIKIAAFQSLLAADPKRALEVVGDVLSPDSKASETLKQEVLRVLRSPRRVRNQSFVFVGGGGIDKQFAPLLRETLVKSFQNEKNVKIRREIIYSLGSLSDERAFEQLAQLYASDNDKEIKKAIINAFGGAAGGFYGFGSAGRALGVATVSSAPTRKINFDKLFEIVGREKDVELRRLAFSNLQRFADWSANASTVDAFARLYDDETDEEFKSTIIGALGNAKQPRASKKLMDIAGNEKSDKLKLQAIYWLGTSKDPEILKFLEDLIK